MDPDDPSTATVQVWVAPLVVPAHVLAILVASLSPAERERAGRYRHPDDARRFSVARGWLRHVLADRTGSPPGDVALAAGPGKPRLSAGAGPCFNLSHAGELAVVAVAEREVGVDIEHCGSGRPGLEAARLACTPAEAAALEGLPPGERAEAFLWLWTAKEAYLKATGEGLAVPPDRVHVGTRPPGAGSPVRVTGEPGPRPWWVRELRAAAGYAGAVAAEGPDWAVAMRSTAELGIGGPDA